MYSLDLNALRCSAHVAGAASLSRTSSRAKFEQRRKVLDCRSNDRSVRQGWVGAGRYVWLLVRRGERGAADGPRLGGEISDFSPPRRGHFRSFVAEFAKNSGDRPFG